MTPIIGAFPKALIPLVIVIPGMIAAVLIPQLVTLKAGAERDRRHLQQHAVAADEARCCPTACSAWRIAGLLAAFMAGMAANVSSLNTVFTYDLWQDWLRPGRDDRYYLQVGRAVTVGRLRARHRHRATSPAASPT